jgi:hypothetical protein
VRLFGFGVVVAKASAAALAPLRSAKLRLALAKAMCGGPESATHCLADDLHASIAGKKTRLFAPCYTKNDHFAKAGSGHT